MLPYAFKTVINPVVKSNYYFNFISKMSIMNLLNSYPQLQVISVLFSPFLIQSLPSSSQIGHAVMWNTQRLISLTMLLLNQFGLVMIVLDP